MPYKGPNNEIVEGKKTKIYLYDDKFEYKVDYKHLAYYDKADATEFDFIDEVEQPYFEEGSIKREYLVGVFKKIDIIVENRDKAGKAIPTLVHEVNKINVEWTSSSLELSFDSKEEWKDTYKEIYNYIHKIEDKNDEENKF